MNRLDRCAAHLGATGFPTANDAGQGALEPRAQILCVATVRALLHWPPAARTATASGWLTAARFFHRRVWRGHRYAGRRSKNLTRPRSSMLSRV